MKTRRRHPWSRPVLGTIALGVFWAAASGSGEPVGERTLPSLEEARRQASVLHSSMHILLHAIHDHYYREDENLPRPPAIFKKAFVELEADHQVKLRWLAVEGRAMNLDHEPRTPFDRAAFDALLGGKQEFEQAEKGVYRRAGAIKMSNHCLKCHVPDRTSTRDHTAGLIIEIPIRQ